jgi:hypothetical protein
MIEIQKQVLVVRTVVVKTHESHSGQPMTRRGQPEGRSAGEA